ncbi:phospholipase [Thermaurantimonas aggregans]|uniref:Phospholipase n=1 Tax=Thermaurantimonas aggregans TaxID=2173829 RepID=A0A401XKQ6_9FLAO|nr:dienelactone hydrolase family protein [Thermaurantimonas aggregans]MCX8147952.1 dienelactone hydrolase family protein [Thermaurantimonas aggregans]GCD77615.1 phospholipase [Thermaurantimonas aggregans]
MIEHKTGLIYQYRKPSLKTARGAIFMVHGYGSHELDLFSFADELPGDVHIYSLRAPYRLLWGGYCWYNIDFSADGRVIGQNLEEAHTSKELIHTFIQNTMKDTGLQPGNAILMGFSQGAILGYAVALTYPESLSALVAMSGYINNQLLPESMPYERLKHLEILITHGTEDPIIPFDWAKRSADFLERNNLSHRFYGYHAGHGIDSQSFFEIKKFVSQKISSF